MALAWHMMMRLREDAVIAPSVQSRQTVSRIFLRKGRDFGLVAFCAADTHLHSMCIANRADAGEFARRVEITLQYHLDLHSGFAEAHLRPVRDQQHLRNAFHYILGQQSHHGLTADPFHESSSLPDLVGLRFGYSYLTDRVRDRLPRQHASLLLERYGISIPSNADIRLEDLSPAVEAATLSPLHANPRTSIWKAATAQAAGNRFSRAEMCHVLQLSPRQVSRLRYKPVPIGLVTALKNQLALRAAIRESAPLHRAA